MRQPGHGPAGIGRALRSPGGLRVARALANWMTAT